MKHYRDAGNKVYAFESDGSQDGYIPAGLVLITDAEADVLRAGPAPTPAEIKAAAHLRIIAAYDAEVNALVAGYPEHEIDSWAKQETEARAWLLDNTKLTPWIDAATLARGLVKLDFVNLIIGNADALAPLHGALTGKRQNLRDQIDALGVDATQAQADAIQW